MKHPNPETWSDYVRGLLDAESAASLREHLGSGCARCERQYTAMQAVLRVAETDLRIEPPAQAVRSVKNLFRVQKLIQQSQEKRLSLSLSFDSLMTPAAVGVRSGGAANRHLVYESPEVRLDLQLQAGNDASPLRVVGQVTDADDGPLRDVPAFLIRGGRIYSQDLSGSLGEFSLLGEAEEAPRLCLLIEDDRLIDVELPSPKDKTIH